MNITSMKNLSLASLVTTIVSLGMSGVVQAATFRSASQAVGEGTFSAYVNVDDNNKPSEIGLTISEDALLGLPTEKIEYEFFLPGQASETAINHIGFGWNPQGHGPTGIYNVPHFDFHFYTITPEQREEITVTGANEAIVYKTPAPEIIPEDYVLAPGSGEPGQGAHWIYPGSDEFQGKGFSKTFIYGFYDGKYSFLEPMITKAFLESKQSYTENLKLPQSYPTAAYYPTNYSISFNENTREYTVSLGGLTPRGLANIPEPTATLGILWFGVIGASYLLKRKCVV